MTNVFSEYITLKDISNAYIYPEIPEVLLKLEKVNHNIVDDKIIFIWASNSKSASIVITESYISQSNNNKLTRKIYFDDIDRVYFSPDQFFYVYGKNDIRLFRFHQEFFGMENLHLDYSNERANFRSLFEKLIDIHKGAVLNKRLSKNDIALNEVIAKVEQYFNIETENENEIKEYAQKTITLYDQFHQIYGDEIIYCELELYIILALFALKQHKKALEKATQIIDIFNYAVCYSTRGNLYLEMNRYYEAQEDFLQAYKLSYNLSDQVEYLKNHNESKKLYYENFILKPVNKRKFIIISDYLDESKDLPFSILEKKDLPENILFPIGHPIPKELYVVNHFEDKAYIPISESEELLFTAKIQEFIYFTECLGAKKTTIRVNKSSSEQDSTSVKKSGQLYFGNKKINGKLSGSHDGNIEKLEEIASNYFSGQISTPIKTPFLPENLKFYKHEPSWISLYNRRVNGNILEVTEKISTNSLYSIIEKDNANLKAAFKNFLFDSDLEIDYSMEKTFSRKENFEFEFHIEFEPIENLLSEHKNIKSDNLKDNQQYKYFMDVNEMLSDDNIIDSKERFFLDKLRSTYNIDLDTAAKIEDFAKDYQQYSDNEKDYINEYLHLKNFGEITHKEKGVLERLQLRSKLSNESVVQLEQNADIINS
jgi:hypothetical protein